MGDYHQVFRAFFGVKKTRFLRIHRLGATELFAFRWLHGPVFRLGSGSEHSEGQIYIRLLVVQKKSRQNIPAWQRLERKSHEHVL